MKVCGIQSDLMLSLTLCVGSLKFEFEVFSSVLVEGGLQWS